jgi:hypothetical protein
MYAAHEKLGESQDPTPLPEGERLAAVHSDSEGSDDHVLGSQYSSEGEPYPLSSEGDHGFDDEDDQEFFGALREAINLHKPELDSDGCPLLRTVSDSEYESDDKTSKLEADPEPFKSDGLERLGVIQDSNCTVEQLGVIAEPFPLHTPNLRRPPALRKSTRKINRPPHSEKDNRCFIVWMKIHDLEANVLLDSGCTSDSVSPEFTVSVNLKVHELEEPVPLQLGTVGSRSKINFGLFTEFELGNILETHYFDVINID